MTQPTDDVVEHKVKRAAAVNALHKISGIVAEEQRIDAAKDRYSGWFLRYGILILLMVGAVLARFMGVF